MSDFISYLVVCLSLALLIGLVYLIFRGFRTILEKIVLKIKEKKKGARKDGR